jgi:hypothetical protein
VAAFSRFLVRLERSQDGAELEIGAGAGGRPLVHGRAKFGVGHDGAMGKVEEARAQLGNGGGLRERRAGRHHGLQKRQPQGDPGGLQHCSARNVLLGEEHGASYDSGSSVPGRQQIPIVCPTFVCRVIYFAAPCLRKASLWTMPRMSEDSL